MITPTKPVFEVRSASTVERHGKRAQRVKGWAFNWRLLIATVAALSVAVPLLHFWHAHQVSRNASGLLVLVDQNEARGEWAKAADRLNRYLKLRPTDVEMIVRMAEDYYKVAKQPLQKSHVVQHYARAIALAPERDDLQRRQMALRLEAGDHRAALDQAKQLLALNQDDAEALRVKALALHQQWRLRHSVADEVLLDAYATAIDKNPHDTDLARGLALHYRNELQPSKERGRADLEKLADDVMDHLVATSGRAEAYVARYVYRQQFNNATDPSAAAETNADLERAISADVQKQVFEVWWLAGLRAQVAGEYDTAVKYFQDAIAIDAGDRRGYLGLGNTYSSQGKNDLAIEAWREGLAETATNDIEIELLIAAAEVREERWQRADNDLRKLEKQIAPMSGSIAAEWLGSINLLQGEMAIGRKEFGAAIAPLKQALLLRQAGAASARRSVNVAHVLTRLGLSYGAINQWDQAAVVYQAAANLLPGSPGARLAAAVAWEAAGRYDEAVRQYDEALVLDGVTVGAWVAAANAEYLHQLSLPSSQRDWQALVRQLTKARQALSNESSPAPLLLTLVESEYDAQQGLVEQAVDRCRGIEPQTLISKEIVRRLVFDYESWQRPDEADRLLQEFRNDGKDSLEPLLLSAEVQFRRNHRDEAYRLLIEALPAADEDVRRAIQYRLAVMYLADGKADQARPLLEKAAEARDADLRPLQFLAELDLQSGNVEERVSYDRELEAREGADGTTWRYYRAQRLMQRANKLDKSDHAGAAKLYQQATELQEKIESLRPAWAPGFLLKARLAEVRPITGTSGSRVPAHDDATAIDAYKQAIRLGARGIPVYEALVQLLFRQNRMAEADGYLDQLRDIAPLPDEMSTIAMAIDVRQGNLDRAITLAREQAASQPDDAMRHLRLGMLLARDAGVGASVDPAIAAEAEKELKRSLELSPADPRAWAGLLSFYIGNDQKDQALNLLEEAERTSALGGEETPFFVAQGYEKIGEEKRATVLYSQAIAAAPERAAVQFQSAAYFFKRDPQLAEKCLRRALEIEPNHRGAAELLAGVLAARGGPKEEAEIDRLLSEGPIEPRDQRLHAMLLMRRGGTQYRRHAQELLEALAGDARQAKPIDHLLLARIYEAQAKLAETRGDQKTAEGSLAAAREQLKSLVNADRPAPEYLAAYIDNLLRAGRVADAGGRLDELAKLEPETSNVRTLALRLRWLNEQNQKEQVRRLIDSYVENRMKVIDNKAGQVRALLAAAELYSTYALPEQAEQAFRRASDLEPSAISSLVSWLIKQDRTSDAVQDCIKLAETDASPLTAMVLSSALAVGKPTQEDIKAAEPVMERAMREHADDPDLLFTMSAKELMDGNNEEAIRLLRKVLKLQPGHLPAMNNLAFALSLASDTRNEALEWMAKAISQGGGNAELLDSKGWVLLQQQKLPEAIEAFQDALARAPTDPRYHFHLALAYHLQGKLNEARDSFQIARQSGLDSVSMPPDERTALARLQTALD
jgi:tetratricopeptide (TPR) repeat protein